jgi:hypothetical protein
MRHSEYRLKRSAESPRSDGIVLRRAGIDSLGVRAGVLAHERLDAEAAP